MAWSGARHFPRPSYWPYLQERIFYMRINSTPLINNNRNYTGSMSFLSYLSYLSFHCDCLRVNRPRVRTSDNGGECFISEDAKRRPVLCDVHLPPPEVCVRVQGQGGAVVDGWGTCLPYRCYLVCKYMYWLAEYYKLDILRCLHDIHLVYIRIALFDII